MRLRRGERTSSIGRGDFARGVEGADCVPATNDTENLMRGELVDVDFGDTSTGSEDGLMIPAWPVCLDRSSSGIFISTDFATGDRDFSGVSILPGEESLLALVRPMNSDDEDLNGVMARLMIFP